MGETPKEELLAWLSRTEISLEARAEYELFRDELAAKLFTPEERAVGIGPSEAQYAGFWDAMRIDFELRDLGARAVEYHFPWYTETRWIIEGYPGAWGWERMIEITRWTE